MDRSIFWDKIAERYSKQPVADEASYQKKLLGFSILHLLNNKEEVIAKVHKMLKPGGIFVTSTACMGDTMRFFKVVAPIGKLFGLTVKVFTKKELERSLTDTVFEIDYQWQPGKGKAVFIVAKKAE